MVQVHNVNGALEAVVAFDDALLPGVVAMSHGWGNRNNPGMSVAQSAPGVNVNVLLPSGPGSFEQLSSQAHMTGIPVEVDPTCHLDARDRTQTLWALRTPPRALPPTDLGFLVS